MNKTFRYGQVFLVRLGNAIESLKQGTSMRRCLTLVQASHYVCIQLIDEVDESNEVNEILDTVQTIIEDARKDYSDTLIFQFKEHHHASIDVFFHAAHELVEVLPCEIINPVIMHSLKTHNLN